MRMSDLSSDVCSSDLEQHQRLAGVQRLQFDGARGLNEGDELGVDPGEAATAAVEQLITRLAKARWLHNALDLLRHAVVLRYGQYTVDRTLPRFGQHQPRQ